MWRLRPDGRRAVLLTRIDWCVRPGERWAVIGPNGAGKSTLMAIAGANAHPSDGVARVLGVPLGGGDMRALRAAIGYVDAGMATLFRPRATTLDVALTGATASIALRTECLTAADRVRAGELLEQLGCDRLGLNRFGELSRGEQQRVLLARALMSRPRLLILDEPTAGLDLLGREIFLSHLDDLGRSTPDLATVQVSHHLEELAASVTHALLLRAGRVVAAGPAAEVMQDAPLSRCFDAPVRVLREGGRVMAVIDRPAGR